MSVEGAVGDAVLLVRVARQLSQQLGAHLLCRANRAKEPCVERRRAQQGEVGRRLGSTI